MKISEVIAKLEEVREMFGDCEVSVVDRGYGTLEIEDVTTNDGEAWIETGAGVLAKFSQNFYTPP